MSPLKRIEEIDIEHVKGMAKRKLSLALLPNKPNLLVAPNGFGKSSLATAFQSLNRVRLDLHKDHRHKEDDSLAATISVTCRLEDNSQVTATADAKKNEISQLFDVFVINSQLVAKAKKIKISGNLIVTPSLEVAPITLVQKIPAKEKFSYSASAARGAFGKNGKVLPSIDPMLKNTRLVFSLYEQVDFDKASGARAKAAVEAMKSAINSADGSSEKILAALPEAVVEAVEALSHINQTVLLIKKESDFKHLGRIEMVLAALQLSDFYISDKKNFKKVATWYEYLLEKAAYISSFAPLKGTWKNIAPVEKKGSLVVEFPAANKISNGERDSICFFAMLMQAKLKLRKSACVLVIDEVFDYLDDANLVAAQYYITELVADFKREGRQLFPLILTHLDPAYFRSFAFSKPNIVYLDKGIAPDRAVEKIIIRRADPSIEEQVSKYFLHFDPGSVDLGAQFNALGLASALSKSSDFASHVLWQLDCYIDGKPYDPVSVCCALRLVLEKWMYESLDEPFRTEFLDTNKTPNKLEFGEEKGVEVPETFFLLGVIYNAAMHLKESPDNFTPIRSKLSNLTIKHMITWARDYCRGSLVLS